MPPRSAPPSTVHAVLKALKAAGTERKRASAIRVGIPMDNAYGVSVGDVRAIGKHLKGRHALAKALWASGIHEARLLATLVADPERMARTEIERWLDDVISWDLCDHLCGNLVSRRADATDLIRRWIKSRKLYVRRAAFALIAELAVHGKTTEDELFAELAALIVANSDDSRPHVRQAASWALRSIGKRNAANRAHALAAAADLIEGADQAGRWVGRDAMRELESLIKVPQRGRLMTSKSRTARKQAR